MKVTRSLAGGLWGLLLVFAAAHSAPDLRAQTPQGRIEVRGLIGSANFSAAGGAPASLRAGMLIPIGSLIKTAPSSAVDLAFSHNAGVVRLVQNSTLSVDKFTVANANADAPVEIQLYLMDGSMLGFEKKLTSTSKYQIKVSAGIADVSGSKYRISAQGYLVLIEGTALFAFIPPSGDPIPFELKAPAPVYFSPMEGIRPAPAELIREVTLQTKGKLKR